MATEVANQPDAQPKADMNQQIDAKIQEQDKILEEAKADETAQAADSDLYDENGNFDEFGAAIKSTTSFKLKERSLQHRDLEDNQVFKRLKNKLIKFHLEAAKYRKFGPTQKHEEQKFKTGVDFSYMVKMHKCLQKMLREVILTEEPDFQHLYLKRIYEWYNKCNVAIGLLPKDTTNEAQEFLNPAQVKAREEERAIEVEKKRLEFMDDDNHDKYMREMFYNEERTEHKGILPARDRIRQYKTKNIRRNIISAMPQSKSQVQKSMNGVKSQAILQTVPEDGKVKFADRPITAGVTSMNGQSEAPTATSLNYILSQNARAASASHFSKFEENDRATQNYPFTTYFTSTEHQVAYQKENRFEGRSNYQYYYPTGETFEQEMEKYWFDSKNKELADKRREEEAKQMMKEWGNARGRMESEIARKKEHLNVATNFAKARGWQRTNWKSKNHKPGAETAEEFLMQSSSDEETSPNKMSTGKPALKVVDLTEDDEAYGFRASTEVQAKLLSHIQEHNDKLAPKKKAKESIKEISAVNVHAKYMVERPVKGDPKYVVKYNNIGLIDECNGGNPDAAINNAGSYSITNMVREVQRKSSKLRTDILRTNIKTMRTNYGNLIGNTPSKNANIVNPFQGLTKDTLASSASAMSLSVYNRPDQLARPNAAKNILASVPGLEVQEVNEEGQPIFREEKKTWGPEFQVADDMHRLVRTGQEQIRLQNLHEIQAIQQRLIQDKELGAKVIPVTTLERAIMMPEEIEAFPGDKKYPDPGVGLMVNPFPKPKKKKKGKKKK